MRDPGDLCILLRHALLRIDDENGNVCALYGAHGAHDHKMLELFLDLILSAKSRRINKDIFLATIFDLRVHGIPCSACDVRDDQTILTKELIDDGGFPYVRLSDDGDLRPFIFLFLRTALREMCTDGLKHVPQSGAVRRRDGNGIPDPKIIKLVDVRHKLLNRIHLIHDKHHGLFRSAEQVCHLRIGVLQALFHVHQENDHVRSVDGDLCLFPHL